MLQSQTDYFDSLSGDRQYLLELAALYAVHFDVNDITGISARVLSLTHQKVKACVDEAVKQGLLIKESRGFRAKEPFMVHVYPLMKNFNTEYKRISSATGYYYDNMRCFRECLYSLLYKDESDYRQAEGKFFHYGSPRTIELYREILKNKAYDSVIKRIDVAVVNSALAQELEESLYHLKPFSEYAGLCERLSCLMPEAPLKYDTCFHRFFGGDFAGALDGVGEDDTMNACYFRAVESVTRGEMQEALTLFEKALKIQRKDYRATYIPENGNIAFYYIVALLCVQPEVSFPAFRKMKGMCGKETGLSSLELFLPVIYSVLDDKNPLKHSLDSRTGSLSNEATLYSLYTFLIYYMCDARPGNSLFPHIKKVVEQAFESGFVLVAYEAAFALHRMLEDKASGDLYGKIAAGLSYPPVLSRIERREDWEKSLNLLLGITTKKAKGKGGDENAARVVYYFHPADKSVHPVLQKRQAKGWSKGRNIGLKTFFAGKTEGMTEQDYRIMSAIVYSTGSYYYADEYVFSDKVFLELIGHPYIFLEGTNDAPIEFVAAKPLVRIIREDRKYRIKAELAKEVSFASGITVVKETNTRYRVYNLTQQQQHIIKILQENRIAVPEAGKDKLLQVIGSFSAGDLEVHSDLPAVESERMNIKDIPADSRIRVQLLPFGDGLKAELFSKPFGDRPPYCKPAKGGKVLLQNQDDHTQIQVKRDFKKELAYENILMNDIQSLESIEVNEGLIAFNDPADSLYLLDVLNKYQDICVVEWPEGERYKIRGTAGLNNLSVKLKSKVNWFELQGELKVDESTVITLQQLLLLTEKRHGRFIELSSGQFLALSNDLRKHLEDLRMFGTPDKEDVKVNRFASIALNDFFNNVKNLESDKAWKEFNKRVNSNLTAGVPVPSGLQTELRPYQEEGFRWMAHLAAWEGGACLADDMGLGKTVQALAILLHRAHLGAALVVCPVSVISNWINEAARFAPSLQLKTLGNSNREQTVNSLQAGDVLVTSYGLLQSEEQLLSQPVFTTAVLDEAHTIKNYATKTSKATMQLQASFRLALTGTPVQNHLGEIWNLFHFINPGLLGSLQHFSDTFIKADNESAGKRLKKLIAPFILRRTKAGVLDELPSKTEIVKKISLSDEETAFYEALRRQAIENLSRDNTPAGAKHIQALAEITKLRQACCNPALVNENVKIDSSKLSAFMEIVGELMDSNHRALVFSQFVSHLSIVRETLDGKGIRYQYLDGSTPAAERERQVEQFQSGASELFLISLKAGGLGLNLTAADYVIHLDPWWNPAIEDQASDRAHRIGQTRPVTIYRLVAENTIEEKIIQLHNTKRSLAQSLLEGSDQSARLSIDELIALIREN